MLQMSKEIALKKTEIDKCNYEATGWIGNVFVKTNMVSVLEFSYLCGVIVTLLEKYLIWTIYNMVL